VASVTPRPYFTPEKDPVPIVQETGWAPGPSGQVRKISPPPGLDPRTVQPVVSRYLNISNILKVICHVTGYKLSVDTEDQRAINGISEEFNS
jgi:hypothetical protein